MRDARINLIFEGSSEIMRLFIAREALDPHLEKAFALVDRHASMAEKRAALARVMGFYPFWYPARWFGRGQVPTAYAEFGPLARHLRFAERHSRKLGRSLFHAMARYGPKLERKQMVLFRAVDIGAELFAIAASCSRARAESRHGNAHAVALADVFCREARTRIRTLFENLFGPTDAAVYRLSQQVLRGEHAWLESGIIAMTDELADARVDSTQQPEPVGA